MGNVYAGTCAVVTGGASGIGRALATLLADQGARVAIADISLERAQEAASAIGRGAKAYPCDVTEFASMAALAEQVSADFGGVNYVFANAGVVFQAGLLETDPSEFDWVFDVNVRGVYNTFRAFTASLLEQGGKRAAARFVITGSENSIGLPFLGVMTAYTATKHALLALADGMRRDLADAGVKVSIFCPAGVNTRLWDARSTRHDRYGGSEPAVGAEAEAMEKGFATLVDPSVTAGICLDGIANDEFLIITDMKLQPIAEARHAEVNAAFAALQARLQK